MKQPYPVQIFGGVQNRHMVPELSVITENRFASGLMKRGQL
jgi:hypothetical protein